MAEEQSAAKSLPHLAEPPAEGRQDEAMRAASLSGARGPASTDDLAVTETVGLSARHEAIPGERDADTLTHREPGSIGGRFTGADIPPPRRSDWLDELTAAEHAREGGGDFVKGSGRKTADEKM